MLKTAFVEDQKLYNHVHHILLFLLIELALCTTSAVQYQNYEITLWHHIDKLIKH